MLRRVGLDGKTEEAEEGRALLLQVRPLVESAWQAADTAEVIAIGKEILSILDLPEALPALLLLSVSLDGVPRRTRQRPPALPFCTRGYKPLIGQSPARNHARCDSGRGPHG